MPRVTQPLETAKYPIVCPKCSARAGFPFQASTQAGRVDFIRVSMRCRECQYEWVGEVAMTPTLSPPGDDEP